MSKKLKWFEKFTDADLDLLVDAIKYSKQEGYFDPREYEHADALIAQLDKIRQSMKAGK